MPARNVLPASNDRSPVWMAHEEPERPFGWGMWLCECEPCRLALRATVAVRPDLPFVLKSDADRVLVTARLLLDTLDRHGEAEALLYVADDWVREIFVANGPVPDGAAWWSLTRAEDAELVGRRAAPRHRPTRQSAPAAQRRLDAHRRRAQSSEPH